MKKIVIAAVLVLSLSGCVSSAVKDAIDTADNHIKMKWATEWRPELIAEIYEVKDSVLSTTIGKIEDFEKSSNEKFDRLNIDIEEFDKDLDGRVTGMESFALFWDITQKNKEQPPQHQLAWWEIILYMAGAYVPLTGGKEFLKSKMGKRNTGDGTKQVVG